MGKTGSDLPVTIRTRFGYELLSSEVRIWFRTSIRIRPGMFRPLPSPPSPELPTMAAFSGDISETRAGWSFSERFDAI